MISAVIIQPVGATLPKTRLKQGSTISYRTTYKPSLISLIRVKLELLC